LVADAGSTDGTPEIVRGFGDRVRYFQQSNQGGAAARNRGISNARGEWMAFLDQDDLWLPEKIERQAAAFLEEPSAGACFTHVQHIGEEGNLLPIGLAPDKARALQSLMKEGKPLAQGAALLPWKPFIVALVRRYLITSCSGVMVRKSALAEVGGFDTEIRGPDDWDLWLKLAVRHSFAYIPDALYRYRHHPWQHTKQGTQVLDAALLVAQRCLRSPEIRRLAGREVILSRLAALHDRCATVWVNQGEARKARAHYLAAFRALRKLSTLAMWAATFCPPMSAQLLDWRTKRWGDEHLVEEREPAG
jgi:glycosyltransferase involved in cell wall biosynthesis